MSVLPFRVVAGRSADHVATLSDRGVLARPRPCLARGGRLLLPEPLSRERPADLSERLDLIVRLGPARDPGVLSDDEFAREKARVLPR